MSVRILETQRKGRIQTDERTAHVKGPPRPVPHVKPGHSRHLALLVLRLRFLAMADQVPAEEQLLVSTIAMVIFSAELPTFRPWVEARAVRRQCTVLFDAPGVRSIREASC